MAVFPAWPCPASSTCSTAKWPEGKKDRTDDEKLFGIQLDSLCDVVAFGAFPAVICYCMGVRGSLGMLAIGFYCVCGVIRLAYFNVVETNGFSRTKNTKRSITDCPSPLSL